MSASSSSSGTDDLTDYDSSSSLEIVVDPKKLKEELKKEVEKESKAAAEQGLSTYEDGTRHKFDKNGRLRSEQMVRLERIRKKRRSLKAQVMKNISLHLQRPSVRRAYNYLVRDNPPDQDLIAHLTRQKVRLSADENRMTVSILRLPPRPY